MIRFKNLSLAILISASLLTTKTFAQDDDRGYIVTVGQQAPDFKLTTTDGKTFQLSENKGKVVMIQFTASWCSVCRKEMPHIENEIWKTNKEKDFVLIGIDRDEPLPVVTEFASKMKITYPLAPDPGAGVYALYANKQSGVTRNVIVDKQGKIVYLTRLYEEKEFNAMKGVIEGMIRSN
jgi:peroxiredoxin